MSCPSCGSALESAARFCGVCGSQVSQRVAAGPKTQDATAPRLPTLKRKSRADELYLGRVLNNRFKVESKIGEGGFGAVYRGVQVATGRKVALKLLHPEMQKDDKLVARFRREGMVLCDLRDAHTITTYDFDQTPDGTLYIAMELLEGKSLYQVFKEQAPLEWQRTFKILIEICSSLAEAHALGIVHRDLKPDNIYLEHRPGNPEFVKVLDFGIAKVVRGDSGQAAGPQLTQTGQTLGTLEYMSPEQLMGKQLDGRSDVYALGVLAYEMVTGRVPFPDAKGPAALITAQLKQTPRPPSVARPSAELPPAVDQVILQALEKDPNNRHPDATAMAGRLREVLDRARAATPNIAAFVAAEAKTLALPSDLSRRPLSTPPPPREVVAAPTPRPVPRPQAAPSPVAVLHEPSSRMRGPEELSTTLNRSRLPIWWIAGAVVVVVAAIVLALRYGA